MDIVTPQPTFPFRKWWKIALPMYWVFAVVFVLLISIYTTICGKTPEFYITTIGTIVTLMLAFSYIMIYDLVCADNNIRESEETKVDRLARCLRP